MVMVNTGRQQYVDLPNLVGRNNIAAALLAQQGMQPPPQQPPQGLDAIIAANRAAGLGAGNPAALAGMLGGKGGVSYAGPPPQEGMPFEPQGGLPSPQLTLPGGGFPGVSGDGQPTGPIAAPAQQTFGGPVTGTPTGPTGVDLSPGPAAPPPVDPGNALTVTGHPTGPTGTVAPPPPPTGAVTDYGGPPVSRSPYPGFAKKSGQTFDASNPNFSPYYYPQGWMRAPIDSGGDGGGFSDTGGGGVSDTGTQSTGTQSTGTQSTGTHTTDTTPDAQQGNVFDTGSNVPGAFTGSGQSALSGYTGLGAPGYSQGVSPGSPYYGGIDPQDAGKGTFADPGQYGQPGYGPHGEGLPPGTGPHSSLNQEALEAFASAPQGSLADVAAAYGISEDSAAALSAAGFDFGTGAFDDPGGTFGDSAAADAAAAAAAADDDEGGGDDGDGEE